jgi:hypothetical protein
MAESLSKESYTATGLPGATTSTRYAGGTNTNTHPSLGTYLTGDYVTDITGNTWICISGGSPGSWLAGGGLQYVTSSGSIVSTATTSSGTGVVRNIWVSSGSVTPTGGNPGDIWVTYT